MTKSELQESTVSQKSESYQKAQLAIDNFNNDLMSLIDTLSDIKHEEFASLAIKLDGVSKNVAFINKYFEEVIARK